MKIQVLGSGCRKCEELMQNAQAAVEELGLDVEVEKVEDPETINDMGVLITPALVIDGDVKVKGKVKSVDEIVEMLEGS
ncbi:MAG: thioredoxin family protein [Spirochaetaceae bacterium]